MDNENGSLDETDRLPALMSSPQSLAVSMVRVEIDQQIATARAYPRSIKQVTDRIFSLATLDKESAEESMYALPRGGKPITGPSIRFAECVKQAYGNCRAAARVVHVDRDEKFVEAEGVFQDLETNVATTARVRRRIVDSKGRLYSDDMIIVTGNAACSIALRNAIMGGVPKPLWRRAYEAVQSTIKGDITTLSENRTAALKAFAVYGVKPEQVFAAMAVPGEADITVEHIPVLRGMYSALKSGEETVESMFSATTAPMSPAPAIEADFTSPKDEAAAPKKARAAKPKEEPKPADPPAAEEEEPAIETETEDVEQETDALAEVIAGAAPAGITYLISSDEPNEQGLTFLYQDGEVFSQVDAMSAVKKHPTYDAHPDTPAEDASVSTGVVEEQDVEGEENLPPELKAYADRVENSATFVEVKTAMADFYGSAFFKALPLDKQNDVRANTWDVVHERTKDQMPDKPDPAMDVSAFRLWIEWVDDADAITGTLAALEENPTFASKSDDFKKGIRAAATTRRQALTA